MDGSGNVYVADGGNNAVKEMPAGCTSSSCVTTLGGFFNEPSGVAVDGSGNIYVADGYNNTVKEMPAGCASSSCVTTLGNSVNGPYAVAVDARGNVYVTNTDTNSGVDELNFATPPSLNFASTNVGMTSSDSPKTVMVENIGNVHLRFTIPASPIWAPARIPASQPTSPWTQPPPAPMCSHLLLRPARWRREPAAPWPWTLSRLPPGRSPAPRLYTDDNFNATWCRRRSSL